MKVSVVGCGRWGTFISWYLDKKNQDVQLIGRKGSKKLTELISTRKNQYLTLPESIKLSDDYSLINHSEVVIISIDSQNLRSLLDNPIFKNLNNKKVILCMKGIEISTGKRLSQVAREFLDESNSILIWVGPGHVQDYVSGKPNCMVIDSEDIDAKNVIVNEFGSSLIRFYYGTDLIGNEIGAAAKNVMGIAAGFLDGMNLGSLKGALMARGTREVGRFISVMGGDENTVYGLSHLGDYEATLFSEHSHNRRFGENYIKKIDSKQELAEGYYTVAAIKNIANEKNIDMPICSAVYAVLYENSDPFFEMNKLFERTYKEEFDC